MANSKRSQQNSSFVHPDQLIGYNREATTKPKSESYLNRDYSKLRPERKKHKTFKPVSDFRVLIPDKTPEEWAENDREVDEWEAARSGNVAEERKKAAGIPFDFLKADLNNCKAEVRTWAEDVRAGRNDGTNLFLKGNVGVGKTYSACAAMLNILKKKNCRFVQFDNILREIKATYDNAGTEAEIVNRYSSTPVLCLDDFGKAHMTEWALPVLFSIIDNRWNHHRPTIFTTQYEGLGLANRLITPNDNETAKAILSRIGKTVMVELKGPDRRQQ